MTMIDPKFFLNDAASYLLLSKLIVLTHPPLVSLSSVYSECSKLFVYQIILNIIYILKPLLCRAHNLLLMHGKRLRTIDFSGSDMELF